ncbi:MAG: prepilin-type N-terminal cleavage/methylation domain-containing protein [Acidimicrobiales bacterium]|jgi:type IV pilus assembly protein PilA
MSFVERCRQRHLGSEGGDEGFTLIELLVVLLIIGILLAIAIPTFLSVTKGANNTAAQANLQNALTGAKTYFTDSNQTYTNLESPSASTSDIQQIGTGLSFVSGTAPSSGPHIVSAFVTDTGSALVLAAFANGTNDCWVEIDNTVTQTAGTTTGGQTAPGTYFGVIKASTPTTCIGSTAGAATFTAANLLTTGFPAG